MKIDQVHVLPIYTAFMYIMALTAIIFSHRSRDVYEKVFGAAVAALFAVLGGIFIGRFSLILATFLAAISAVWLITCSHRLYLDAFTLGVRHSRPMLLGISVAAFVTATLFSVVIFALSPVTGWDALNFWILLPVKELLGITSFSLLHEDFNFSHSRVLPFFFLSVAQLASSLGVAPSFLLEMVYGALYISTALTIGLIAARNSGSPPHTLVCMFLFFCIPLMQNHAFIPGYSELIISLFLLFAYFLLSGGEMSRIKSLLCCEVLLIIAMAKNTGTFYLCALAISGLVASSPLALSSPRAIIAGLVGIFFCVFLLTPLVSSLTSFELFYGDRELRFTKVSYSEVASALKVALIDLQTFSVLPVTFVVCVINLWVSYNSMSKPAVKAMLLGVTFICICMSSSVLILATGFGRDTSPIVGDTSFSRFLLPAAVVCIATIASLPIRINAR